MRTKSWSEIREENRQARIERYAGMTDAELVGRLMNAERECGGSDYVGTGAYATVTYLQEEIQRRQVVAAQAVAA